MTFSGVASQFAGVPLAFAFLATLGRTGLVTTLLIKYFGFNLYGTGFNLLSFWGLTLTYLYFQIPLMVLVLTPALDGLKREWREAAEILGASSWQYWRYVVLPVLWPSFLGATLLLFANSFGAIATAFALTGSSLNIVTILLYAQIRGDVLHDPNLGYALALGMIFDHRAVERRLHLAAPAQRAVAAMKAVPARRLARRHRRQPLFPGPADRHVRVLAAHAPRRIQFRRLSCRARRSELPGHLRLLDPDRPGHHRRRDAPGGADRLLDPAAPAAPAAVVEFITLLPLVIPAIVIVFGYLRLYNSSSILPMTATRARPTCC